MDVQPILVPQLSKNALTVLERRYLKKDRNGAVCETPADMFSRVAEAIANADRKFDEKTETYIEIPSDRVPFEQRPWMKAAEITDAVVDALRAGKHRFARLNFANGDMVGHTGVRDATIYAVEAVDLGLGRLLSAIAQMRGIALITADHGNADEMYERDKSGGFAIDPLTGRPRARTSHSLSPVPFAIFDPAGLEPHRLRTDLPAAGLANVAATALHLLGFEPPPDYEANLLV